MAAATKHIMRVRDGVRSPYRKVTAGWVGSKAGSRRHFCQVTAAGVIDQAAAADNAVATVRVALLHDDIASTVAVDSDDALAVGYRPCRETTFITLPLITSGTSKSAYVSVAATHQGDLVGLCRMTAGEYAWDTTGTDYGEVVDVDVDNGLVTCKILEAKRLA